MEMNAPKRPMPVETDPRLIFQVCDSLTVLLLCCGVGILFTVLLFFYPGQAFLGANFWPLIALPAALAIGCGIKLLIRKPILQVDAAGIRFYRSGIFIEWKRLQSAEVVLIKEDATDEGIEYLVVKYADKQSSALLKLDFEVTGGMDKTGAEIGASIVKYRPWSD